MTSETRDVFDNPSEIIPDLAVTTDKPHCVDTKLLSSGSNVKTIRDIAYFLICAEPSLQRGIPKQLSEAEPLAGVGQWLPFSALSPNRPVLISPP
jgi:hypothetical protein